MYQINLVTYSTEVNIKNARRKVANREKRIFGGRFESVKLARKALKEFFGKNGYLIGNEVEKKAVRPMLRRYFSATLRLKWSIR